jgi:hypothetical protein
VRALPASLALLLLALPLSGCFGGPPPAPPAPPDPEPPRSPPGNGTGPANATPAPPPRPLPRRITFGGPSNEASIAVDPTNPDRILVGAKDYSLFFAPPCPQANVWAGVYASTDGGKLWRHSVLPGFPYDTRPGALQGYRCVSDPTVAFDAQGTAYYAGLAFGSVNGTVPAVPPTPVPVPPPPPPPNASLPVEADADPMVVFLAKSRDGGITWDEVHIVVGGQPASQNLGLTRPYLAIDGARNALYMSWAMSVNSVPSAVDGVPSAVVSRSADGGATWSAPVPLVGGAPAVLGSAPVLAVLPDGKLLAAWLATTAQGDGTVLEAALSADGGQTFGAAVAVAPVRPPPSPLPNSQFRVATFPALAVDASPGERRGWAYLVWNDYGGGDSDVLFAASKDGGATWGEPVSIHESGARNDQFLPAAVVTAAGDVDVLFYDRRGDPANRLIVPYFADSHDGGATWNETALPMAGFDGDLSLHQSGQPFLGDYIGIASAARGSWGVWTATPFGRADLFVLPV